MKHYILCLTLLPTCLFAQDNPVEPKASFEKPSYESPLPYLLEVGTSHSHLSKGIGNWRSEDATFTVRSIPRFTPVFQFTSQTRPEGTSQNFAFSSYYTWSKHVYTTQGFSLTPTNSGNGVMLFPHQRYDFRAHYIVPSHSRLVLSSGLTYFDFPGSVKGQIYSTGFLYYAKKTIIGGNYNVNRNQPGDHTSSSANMSVQYGREGKYWIGATVGGGKEVYSYFLGKQLDVNLNGFSTQAFFRKWLSRHYGFVIGMENQNKLGFYTRIGAYGRMFFEF